MCTQEEDVIIEIESQYGVVFMNSWMFLFSSFSPASFANNCYKLLPKLGVDDAIDLEVDCIVDVIYK